MDFYSFCGVYISIKLQSVFTFNIKRRNEMLNYSHFVDAMSKMC